MVDIGSFRDSVRPGEAAPAVRFTTISEPIATSESRVFSFVFSDENVDRYNDIIYARGWDLKNFNQNPIALFGHNASSVENVIGRAKNVRVQGTQLLGDIEFLTADINPNAEAVYRMVAAGYLKTVSVGFAPVEWEATKDRSRVGGVDFKKSELLEISVVPIPANPNALVQAKAAGIEIERLGLRAEVVAPEPAAPEATETRVAPKIVRKGLYSVSFLAQILCDLGYLQDSVAWEAEYEGDGSAVPAALMDAMKALGQVLIDMTAEEVSELLAGEDDDELGVIGMSGAGARVDIARAVAKLTPHALAGFATVARDLAAGRTVHVKTVDTPIVLRAGKVISSANEKTLREAHGHMTAACECVMSVVEPDDADPEAGDGDEERALRERKARAQAAKAKHAA